MAIVAIVVSPFWFLGVWLIFGGGNGSSREATNKLLEKQFGLKSTRQIGQSHLVTPTTK
jgi:hypothetical protein